MKILFVCTANEERSPTAEMVFKDVPGWETKSAGTSPDAVVPVSRELIDWADRIVVMQSRHARAQHSKHNRCARARFTRAYVCTCNSYPFDVNRMV